MKSTAVLSAVLLAFAAGRYEAGPASASPFAPVAEAAAAPQDPAPQDPAAAMKKWMATMKPSENHKFLAQFVGKWETTTRLRMGGPADKPLETKGTAEYRWLVEGKWLLREAEGSMPMMGKVKSFTIFGYDNYKHKFVSTQVDSMTTAMLHAEGMLDQSGKTRFLYGPMDEPMTDEHDKPVKYATRVISADEHVEEVHDLAIGETGTLVIDVVYRRAK